PFYLLTAQSLRSDGDLDLWDDYRNEEYRSFWDADIPLWKQMTPAPDGRLLSPHDPGLSLLTLPAYALGGLRGVQRLLVVVWALAMALSTLLAIRFRAPPAAAVLAAIAVGAGAPGIVYASQVYPEAPAALLVAAGLLLATNAKPRPLLMAATVVALPWLGSKYIALAALVAAVFAYQHRQDRRTLALAAVPAALAGAHYLWWHLHTFGGLTPYGTNIVYSGEGTAQIFGEHLGQGGRSYRLYGLFLDARFGLFRWLPLAPLALFGLARRTLLPAATVLITVLIGTFVSVTMMGWWFPGRMLIAGLPALVVLIAHGARRLPKTAAALAAWSLAIGAATAWSAHHGGIRLAVDPWTLGAPLPPHWLFPDFRRFGLPQVAASLAWAAALLAALLAAARVGRSIAPNGQAPPPRRQLPRVPRLLRPAD
ncbi:MAG TPA: hypothetical protein VGO92_09595, partial [Acidimicrobiales bacterium]|nr:hypothetical protein [Acidimicrobiales bacterium]